MMNKMFGRRLALAFFLMRIILTRCNVVKLSPSCKQSVCEFDWTVDYKFTMMWYNRTSDEPEFQPVLMDRNHFLQRRSTTPNCTETYNTVTFSEFQDLVSPGDGNYRMVYAINGRIPGPEIVVTEGDMVVIRIRNRLKVEGLTIHWHGLLHRGTPWMDGASMISQCPILPGQSFEYRFIAEPVGTHWYHAHTNTMRSDGLSGAFIVLPKQSGKPRYSAEFFAVIQDWTKRSAAETAETYRNRLFGLDEYDGKCQPAEYMPDGGASIFALNVGLVNGRGRPPRANSEYEKKAFIPLETFTVQRGETYRFRIINVGFAAPFKISFEAHIISVLAFDGNEVEEQKCDAVVISPGESVDIKIRTNQSPNNYYINVETLTTMSIWGPIEEPGKTRALLNYQGINPLQEPPSVQRLCTAQNPCVVVNQIYGMPPLDANTMILPLSSLRSTQAVLSKNPVPVESPISSLQEFFLHFHIFRGHPAINGIRFMYPTSALQTYPKGSFITPCQSTHCTSISQNCRCTHTLKLEIYNTIQFVFFTRGVKAPHPIHFHGHQFHVVKIGYPEYNHITGNATAPNPDITCLNDDCTQATWANPSWRYGVPGLNLKNPPIKDTVNIPWGGYVVVRITADNPGYWLLHCHLAHHQSQGMTLVLKEGDISDMISTPPNFPSCNNFQSSQDFIKTAIKEQKKSLARTRYSRERVGNQREKDIGIDQMSPSELNEMLDLVLQF